MSDYYLDEDIVYGESDSKIAKRASNILMIILAILIVGMLFLFSQELLAINDGEVLDKKFTPSYDIGVVETRLDGNDVEHRYLIQRHYFNEWKITVYGYNWLGMERTEDRYVTEERYNSLEIGDHWENEDSDSLYSPGYYEDPIAADFADSSGSGGHITVVPHPG